MSSAGVRNVSHLVVDAQSEMFSLPSHGLSAAAQPRLPSLVHVPGRTALKLGRHNSPNVNGASKLMGVMEMMKMMMMCWSRDSALCM